jgi:hypothetical protein
LIIDRPTEWSGEVRKIYPISFPFFCAGKPKFTQKHGLAFKIDTSKDLPLTFPLLSYTKHLDKCQLWREPSRTEDASFRKHVSDYLFCTDVYMSVLHLTALSSLIYVLSFKFA